jgi:fatty acid synthase subunit alpha
LVLKQRVKLGSTLLHRCTLNVWVSLFPTGGGGGSAGGSSGGAVMNSEEFLKFQAEQHEFAHQQINLYSRYLKRDPRQGEILYDKEKATLAQIQARLDSIAREHGDIYVDGIQPVFDALKARHFDSSWNWVRQDAFSCSTISSSDVLLLWIVESLLVVSLS